MIHEGAKVDVEMKFHGEPTSYKVNWKGFYQHPLRLWF